ncbi:hypothetical protein NPIL_69041, partial [Nephila pilipes]
VWLKPKSFKETFLKSKASLEIEEIMNFLLSVVVLFSLNSILFGSENSEMKGNLLTTIFPFPMDQDFTKNRNERIRRQNGVIHPQGVTEPINYYFDFAYFKTV